uniref:Clp R domain-containing protein n=1 Tax=Populus trichocarpa TaxID=3694 RepID=A0A2K2C3F9_POPTR|eukprot:XP_024466437.1 protein SMAX1-LIKE 6 [Populus trichocarpa]
MPTPVSVARQCLTDEAARALDEAVAVARRRNHCQTTSLHAVSALLALPASTLRDACSRATTNAFSSRRQFRALDLSVGVSLDRLPSSRTLDEDPPISNSLMAAIKRSQANQRRHPDNFHLHQIHCNQQAASVLKVEMKHFILSILDDPIVSRVFGEAGFRSYDIKIAIVHPPVSQSSKYSPVGCAPIFLCNLPGSNITGPGRPPGFSFPFSSGLDDDDVGDDDVCRRIGEALVRRDGKGRNLLLVGVYASKALKGFVDSVNKENKGRVLPSEIGGVSVISIEDEIIHFVSELGGDKEKMGLKFEELGQELEQYSGPGIVVNFGDMKVLVGENVCGDAVSYLVSKLTSLLEGFRGKIWLVGTADSYDTYLKSVGRFSSVEKDWDLRVLPIASYKSPVGDFSSKSSLLGSFVPFGGFFSTPSDFKKPTNSINQSIICCHLCNAKYEKDVAAILKMGSTTSVADQSSEKLPSLLQMAELDTGKAVDAVKTRDDDTALNAKILGLRNKWNDICQRLHHAQPFFKFDVSQATSQVSIAEGFQCVADEKKSRSNSSSRDSSLNESQCVNLNLGVCLNQQKIFPAKHCVDSETEDVNHGSKQLEEVPRLKQKEKESPWFTPCPLSNVSLPSDRTSSSSVTSVTTHLGLGTLYATSAQEHNITKLRDPMEHLQHFSGSGSAEFDDNTSLQIAKSSSFSGPFSGGKFNLRDFKSVMRAISEKVGWQDRATYAIGEAVSRCKAGHGRHHGSNSKGDISFILLGPDRIGKKKIASALAEVMFGSTQSFISLDLGSHDKVSSSNSIFDSQELQYDDELGRSMTFVDRIASKLSKKPHSLIFLENIDKADPLVQHSLSYALRTGRFPDSRGREVSTNNTIFVATSTIIVGNTNFLSENKSIKFSEEMILGAKSWQMQILVEHAAEATSKRSEMKVRISREITSAVSYGNKRKLDATSDLMEQESSCESSKQAHKALRSYLDLNLPVEDTGECANYGDTDSDSISESSQAWLEDFSDQVDEKVVFKTFDFDSLAEKIVKEIGKQFQMAFGYEILLEIDDEVMVQILAAAWLSEKERAMEDWIEEVVGRGFRKAKLKSQFSAQCVVKLVTCKGLVLKEQAPGIRLPSRINL